jgi:hypothetical protein
MEKKSHLQKSNEFQLEPINIKYTLISRIYKRNINSKMIKKVRKLKQKKSYENLDIAIKKKGWTRLIELVKSKLISKSLNSSSYKKKSIILDDSKFQYGKTTSNGLNEIKQMIKYIKFETSHINNQKFKKRSSDKLKLKNKKFLSQKRPIEYENIIHTVNKKNSYFLYLHEDLIEFSFNDDIGREDFMINGFKNMNEEFYDQTFHFS